MGLSKDEEESLLNEVFRNAYAMLVADKEDRALFFDYEMKLDDYTFKVDLAGTCWESMGVYAVGYEEHQVCFYVDVDYFAYRLMDEASGVLSYLAIDGYKKYFKDSLEEQIYFIVTSNALAKKNRHSMFCWYSQEDSKKPRFNMTETRGLNLQFRDSLIIDFGSHHFDKAHITYAIGMQVLRHFKDCEIHCSYLNLYKTEFDEFQKLNLRVIAKEYNLYYIFDFNDIEKTKKESNEFLKKLDKVDTVIQASINVRYLLDINVEYATAYNVIDKYLNKLQYQGSYHAYYNFVYLDDLP